MPNKMKWISIDKQLPPEGEFLLIGGKDRVECGVWDGEGFCNPDEDYSPQRWGTHWMKLPDPPK